MFGFACCSTCGKVAEDDLEAPDMSACLVSTSELPLTTSALPVLPAKEQMPEVTRKVEPSKTQAQKIKKPPAKKVTAAEKAAAEKAEAKKKAAAVKAKTDKLQGEAEAEVKSNNFTAAVGLFSAAIDLNSECAIAFAGRGNARLRLSSLNEALSDLNEAIRLDTNLLAAMRDRAEVKSQLDDLAGSLDDYNKYLTLVPCDGRALHLRGSLKLRQGKKDEGENDFRLARRLGYRDFSEGIPKHGGA